MTSTIKVNTITTASGSTLTLGESGKTVTIASGASTSGMGRTGTVDWQTSIKTSTITAVNGEGYFVNTTGGAITANLPAGSVGSIVAFKDYAQTFDTNALTISANGSEKIEGLTTDLILSTEGIATTLVYGDTTKGWQAVNSNEVVNVVSFVSGSGGTVSTSGDFKIHTFTGPGTFTVSCAGSAGGSNSVDYLVVAGGGSGAWDGGGGAGSGGYRFSNGTASGSYTAGPSPLGASALPVSAQGYPVTIGAGGAAITSSTSANPGANSIFSSITSTGGGKGGNPGQAAGNGGSGGGIRKASGAGSGNTPPVSPPQGNNGNTGPGNGGGGGGAGAVGVVGAGPPGQGGAGGAGLVSCITASPVARGGGGGGGNDNPGPAPAGGSGGGGAGGNRPNANAAGSGTANTGGGGGGAGVPGSNGTGAGGSGIVIIRYKFQWLIKN